MTNIDSIKIANKQFKGNLVNLPLLKQTNIQTVSKKKLTEEMLIDYIINNNISTGTFMRNESITTELKALSMYESKIIDYLPLNLNGIFNKHKNNMTRMGVTKNVYGSKQNYSLLCSVLLCILPKYLDTEIMYINKTLELLKNFVNSELSKIYKSKKVEHNIIKIITELKDFNNYTTLTEIISYFFLINIVILDIKNDKLILMKNYNIYKKTVMLLSVDMINFESIFYNENKILENFESIFGIDVVNDDYDISLFLPKIKKVKKSIINVIPNKIEQPADIKKSYVVTEEETNISDIDDSEVKVKEEVKEEVKVKIEIKIPETINKSELEKNNIAKILSTRSDADIKYGNLEFLQNLASSVNIDILSKEMTKFGKKKIKTKMQLINDILSKKNN